MAVRVITAPPGHGKTLNMTRKAIQIFNNQNSFLSKIINKKNYIYYNSIYSNYPILLKHSKKKFKYMNADNEVKESVPIKKIYDEKIKKWYYSECEEEEKEYYGCFSIYVKFTDMRLKYNFGWDASFFIDELQYIYDSQEYKDFPDCIAHFFQVHRHLNYNMIYTNSQSLSRVIKRVLCVSEEFWNVLKLKHIFGITYVKYIIRTDISTGKDNENKSISNEENYDIYRDFYFNKWVFNGYITKYLNALNDDLPMYKCRNYKSLKMPKNFILNGFMISQAEKEELKKQTF